MSIMKNLNLHFKKLWSFNWRRRVSVEASVISTLLVTRQKDNLRTDHVSVNRTAQKATKFVNLRTTLG
jgi:hypothetical protein